MQRLILALMVVATTTGCGADTLLQTPGDRREEVAAAVAEASLATAEAIDMAPVDLPGPTGGVRDGLEVLDGVLDHVLDQLHGGAH